MKTSGEQVMERGDILVLIDFKKKTIEEYPIEFGTQLVYVYKGISYTSLNAIAIEIPNMTIDKAIELKAKGIVTEKHIEGNSLACYTKGNHTYIAGLNHNMFSKPTILQTKSRYTISILKRNPDYKEFKEIIVLLQNKELALDLRNHYTKYIKGINKKVSHKAFLESISNIK